MADQAKQQVSEATSSTIEVVVDHQRNSRKLANGNGHESSPRENTSVFEPNLTDDGRPSPASFSSRSTHRMDAPEKKLTLFALRLAMLEKSASSLGALGFIWATVVLLGGFAIVLDTVDFWVVTTILVIEGARIFSRSHELEWQHQATRSVDSGPTTPQGIFRTLTSKLRRRSTRVSRTSTSGSFPSDRQTRTRPRHHDPSPPRRAWKSSEVPFVPYVGWVLDSTSVSRMLYWLQLVSASTCVALSLARLSQQSFGEVQKGDTDKRNRKAALNIFYGLALAEALLFLIEKLYWEFEISVRKLLEAVSQDCGLGNSPADLVPIRRFFFDAFSRCIEGSIFDGAKMELVSFAEELLGSDSRDEQLIGARILCQFAGSKEFGRDTLRKIGTSTATMERLVEMLNWKSPSEAELRLYAAEVVSELASKKQNVLRVAGIPGSMESIASLLANINSGTYSSTKSSVSRPHEVRIIINSAAVTGQMDLDEFNYDHMTFNLLGLSILKRLAHNHENCGKIGNTRDLLPRIIQFTAAEEWLTGAAAQQTNDELKKAKVKAAKRSLRLLQMLANASGATGKLLRKEIADIVFTVGNMRDIVRHGGDHRVLQKSAIEILTCLTLDVDARERIGATGGVVPELFRVFFEVNGGCSDKQHRDVGLEAGEALAMLALENRDNCRRMLHLQVVDKLTMALSDTNQCVSAARILTNLCTYGDSQSLKLLRGVTKAAPTVLLAIAKEGKKSAEILQAITTQEKKTLEVSIGLAVQIFHLMSQDDIEEVFREAGINQADLVTTLIQVLKSYKQPSVKEPRMRKYAIELTIWMMKSTGEAASSHIITAFKAGGLQEHLQNVADTTSELELYNVFSGMSGLSRHEITIESLVETAMGLLSPPDGH